MRQKNATGGEKRMQAEQRLDLILEGVAAESDAQRTDRWRNQFDRVAGPLSERLVLFGAGQFGQWVLDRLRKAGVDACCFSDNNPQRWGTRVKGLEVLAPETAVRRFGQTASFVVTIFNGSSARAQLKGMGCERVPPVTFLFWKHPEQFMPDLGIGEPERVVEEPEEIRRCCRLLSDERSRQELCDQISFRYWMEPEFLPLPENVGEIYFPTDIVKDSDDEVFVDCGAFDGDSIRSFLRRGRSLSHLYALEPDAYSRALLAKSVGSLSENLSQKITVWPYGAGNLDGQVNFAASGDVASKISSSNTGTSIEVRKLDSLDWQHTPTYIKMDIEGAEPDALAGAANLLRDSQPVLAICLYHRLEHLWQLPNLIHSFAPGYSLFLRRYAEDGWEQVCYAVPPSRLA
jgi:FkbM family methyltransferase